MSTLAKLMVSLGLSSEDFGQGLDAAEKKASTSAAAIGASLGKVGAAMSKIGTGMSVGVTLPIVAGFGASIAAASDMNETMSKSNAVFGDFAASVQAFASMASTNLE